jgi:cytochrome c oxidase subunit 4
MTEPASTQPSQRTGHGSSARYFLVWAALLLLTVLTIVVGRINLGEGNLIVALAIALTKGTLVALFFMHLWEGTGENRLVLVVAVVFVSLLSLGVVTDFATRLPTALPPVPQAPSAAGHQ